MEIPGMRTGYVTGRVVVTVNDSSDPGSRFDAIAPTGWIYLTPRADRYAAGIPRIIAFPDRLSLAVDSQGYVTVPDEDGNPTGVRTIEVPVAPGMTWQVTGDVTIPPYEWQDDVDHNRVVVHPFDIPIEADETTDLADYLPIGVSTDGSTVWTQGQEGKAGRDGADGRDGANVLPTGVAIAEAIGPGGIARDVMEEAITQTAVTSPTVGRIVTSTDPTEPLEDGEVLLVYQGPRKWAERFEDGLWGMTPRGQHRDQWTWANGAATIPQETRTSGRRGLSFDELGDRERDVELLARVYTTGTTSTVNTGLFLRGDPRNGVDRCFAVCLINNGFWVLSYTPTGANTLSNQTLNRRLGVDIMIRFRADDRLRARLWHADDPEPDAWQYEDVIVGNTGPGLAGLFTNASTNMFSQRWLEVAVATQGETAVL